MDPAQLLNPKAYAKQQKAKKRMPNYGPKQTKKIKPDNDGEVKVNLPTYDPRALLNPKAGAKQAKMDNEEPSANEENSISIHSQPTDDKIVNGNPTNIYEKLHNLENRDSIRSAKRKATTPADNEDEEVSKKQKSTFSHAGGSSALSEGLKKDREKIAAANGPDTSIDLTGDNDNDNEVIITGESDGSEEVCLGCLKTKANSTVVPAVSMSMINKLDKDYWPPTRVGLSRQADVNTIIDVVDQTKRVFGRIDPTVAVALVPLMDGANISKLRVKAFLDKRKKQQNEKIGDAISQALNLTITLYAPRNRATNVGRFLSRKQLWLSNPFHIETGKEVFNPHDLRPNHTPRNLPSTFDTTRNTSGTTVSVSIVQRTVEEMRREASTVFDQLVKNDGLDEMEADPDIITTPLMKHQKQALRFLFEHEVHDFTIDDQKSSSTEKQATTLWKSHIKRDGKESWYNIITGQEVDIKPEPTRGGILADMMGLGKTLSILALVAATRTQAKAFRRTEVPAALAAEDGVNSRATLIVCPKSVLTNWQEQIAAHAKNGNMTFLVYHGPTRTQDVHELATKDVILTSYGTIANEATSRSAKKRPSMKVNWFRVVLDEAHFIRNSTTAASKAVCLLEAERRWAVTGTPIQNRLEDMGTLVKFVRVKPFDEADAWSRYLTSRFKAGSAEALNHLKILIQSITLRRAKDAVGMVSRTEVEVKLNFSIKERSLYTAFAVKSKTKLQALTREGGSLGGRSHAQWLKNILRLRLICAHGQEMLSPDDMEEIKGYDESNAIDLGDEPDMHDGQFTTDKAAYEHLNLLVEAQVDQCSECYESFIKTDSDNEQNADAANTIDKPAQGDDDVISISDEEDNDQSDSLGLLTPCFHLIHNKCREAHQKRIDENRLSDNYHTCEYCQSHVLDEYFELTRSGLAKYRADRLQKMRAHKKASINPETYEPHTKVVKLIEELRASAEETAKLPEGEPPIRSVVFSEWTTYLDLIGYALEEAGIPFVRLDGTMSLRARSEVLQQFKSDPNTAVLLVSIRAGGTGLNFTAANKVYLMEPQWNPGVEAQAVDRVHRLGQTRDVLITRFIMAESVEMRMLELQEKKKKLAHLSMERKLSRDDEAKNKLQELKDLFK